MSEKTPVTYQHNGQELILFSAPNLYSEETIYFFIGKNQQTRAAEAAEKLPTLTVTERAAELKQKYGYEPVYEMPEGMIIDTSRGFPRLLKARNNN